MQFTTSLFRNNITFLIVGLSFFVCVVVRSFLLDITYDEAWTLIGYVPLSYSDIISYANPNANNHLLNTVLIKFIYSLGLENVFFARLPNILASVFYLYFGIQIARKYFKKNQIVLVLLLTVNPFLIDFFSLARGYGLSMCFLMGSIWFLLNFSHDRQNKWAFYAIAFGMLTVLSSFTTIYFVPALFLTLIWLTMYHKLPKKQVKQLVFGCLALLVVFVAIIYEPFRKLIESDSLWFGGNVGFYDDTLFSLVYSSTGEFNTTESVKLILNTMLILVLALFIFRTLAHSYKNRKWNSSFFIFSLLLFVPVFETIVNHYFLGTKFLVDRTALFLLPLVVLWLTSLSNQLKDGLFEKGHTFFMIFMILVMLFNFVSVFQLKSTITWFQDAHTREILSTINKIGKTENRIISFDVSWPFRSSVGYYQSDKVKDYPFTKFVENEPEYLDSSAAEYYIFLGKSIPNVGYYAENELVPTFKRDTLLFFEQQNIVVLKNK